MGRTEEILNMEPFVDKFRAFGWDAVECDGHSMDALNREFEKSIDAKRPRAIVARTIKGKGVSFMEANNVWHYTRLDQDLFTKAVAEVSGNA
jgi:transketolase